MYEASKSNWTNPSIEYIFGDTIIEYDMKSAGISIIRELGLLPQDELRRLAEMDKADQVYAIGMLQRNNKQFTTDLLNGFTQARQAFIHHNSLDDSRIITVKKDAIFVIGSVKKRKFGEVQFVEKNVYTSYLRLQQLGIELFKSDHVDVKGIGEIGVAKHRLYMLSFLEKMFDYIENKNYSVKRYLSSFIAEYKAMRLDDGYYLEFNRKSMDINPMFNFTNILIPLVHIVLGEINK